MKTDDIRFIEILERYENSLAFSIKKVASDFIKDTGVHITKINIDFIDVTEMGSRRNETVLGSVNIGVDK